MAEWIIPDVIEHTPEMLWGCTPNEVRTRLIESCVQSERIELAAFCDNRLVGFCVLVSEEDANVGRCLGIMWNFVLPEYRGRVGQRFMRTAIRVARNAGLPIIAYTHRLGEGKYAITYRRIHGKENLQEGRQADRQD